LGRVEGYCIKEEKEDRKLKAYEYLAQNYYWRFKVDERDSE